MKPVQANNTELPENFLDGFTSLETSQKQQLIEALNQKPPVSVRLNPAKNIIADPKNKNIGWCSNGYYLPERAKFTLDPKHHGGAYYVQEAGSMFIEQLFSQSITDHNSPLRILDLCASPGGKSTLLSSLLPEGSLLVANEVIRARTSILSENIRRWGWGNTAVSSNDASHFGKLDSFFDVIVVDAPCSGEGMFRKDAKARSQWSTQAVEMCAARQKRILSDIWPALKPNGILIYSTCTFNDQENEDNVRWLSENFDCAAVHITTQDHWGIMRGETCGIETFRFLPHRVKSEGFFAAILRKESSYSNILSSQEAQINKEPKSKNNKKRNSKSAPSSARNIFTAVSIAEQTTLEKWVNNPSEMHFTKIGDSCFAFDKHSFEDLKFVAENLNVCYSGVAMGRFFGSDFKPEHALALYKNVNRNACANIELNLDQAIEYLCKNELEASLFEEGMNLLSYKNTPIGWLKRSNGRTTNMLPKELRIINLNLLT